MTRPRVLVAGLGHRAQVPDGFACDRITAGPVGWSTGQQPMQADAVLRFTEPSSMTR